MNIFALFLSFITLITPVEKNKTVIPAIFSDNMVLQQKSSAPFWGKAEPGTKINVKGSWGKSVSGVTGSDGKWSVKLSTPSAGGPFSVTLQVGDSVINYKNVMSGEVWICSGQSNMEMPLTGWLPNDTIKNSKAEINSANISDIRLFNVQHQYSDQREFDCVGTWQQSTPQTASQFSATAYFFGKRLHDDLKIPIGLINTSLGGTPVEAWMSKEELEKYPEYKNVLEGFKTSSAEIKKFNEWLFSHKSIQVPAGSPEEKWKELPLDDQDCADVNFDDKSWHNMKLPVTWESTEIGSFDGVVWFRKKVSIPAEWVKKDLVVELGPIDDMDVTYVNGKEVGRCTAEGFYKLERVYKVPGDLINGTEISIAVKVIDAQGGGGIYGTKEMMKIHPANSNESLDLSGDWKYLPVALLKSQKLYIFGTANNDYFSKPVVKLDLNQYTPTSLFNAMINPIVPFAIKGVIWYQGEANVGNAYLYKNLFTSMIEGWRSEWNIKNFPVYFVQIAPYDYGTESHSEFLREAQFKTLSVPNTGMAVTMDIGNPKNIHPPYKPEVGNRLALWALANTYKKKMEFSGPLYKSFKIEKDKVVIEFTHAGKNLVIKEKNGENNFVIAGADKVFKKASVEIKNNKLIVYNTEVKNPAAVRYAWSNILEGTLFNDSGLPASSFRTDSWDK